MIWAILGITLFLFAFFADEYEYVFVAFVIVAFLFSVITIFIPNEIEFSEKISTSIEIESLFHDSIGRYTHLYIDDGIVHIEKDGCYRGDEIKVIIDEDIEKAVYKFNYLHEKGYHIFKWNKQEFKSDVKCTYILPSHSMIEGGNFHYGKGKKGKTRKIYQDE